MTYHFKNIKTGKIIEVTLKITEYDAYKKAHPELERFIATAPAVTYNGKTFGSLDSQTDNTWKEVLAKIGENHPTSKIADSYRKNKSVKEAQTKEVILKHQKKMKDLKKAN